MADCEKHNQCVFTWRIKNFLSSYTAFDEKIESPTFNVDNMPVKSWKLVLYPRGNSGTSYCSKDMIVVYLARVKPDNYSESVALDLSFKILSVDGCVLVARESKGFEMKQRGGHILKAIKELHQLMKNWDEDTLTIRCFMTHIITEKEGKVQCIKSEAVTIIDVDRFIFQWHVSNVGCFDWSESMSDPHSIMPNLKIDLIAAAHETVNIIIQILDESSKEESVLFRMKFLTANGIKLASVCELHSFESTEPWVLPTSISIKKLSTGSSWPSSYKYTLIFECIISKNTICCSRIENRLSSSIVKKEFVSNGFPTSLQNDFRELFLNKKQSDVKLKVNNINILAHKVVLSARSPVFSAMFDQDMLENHSGIVQIKDLNEETLEDLLEFMYTDVVNEMDCEAALNLLLAADKYQVSNLKDKCTSNILSLLSEENVCEVLIVADMINHASLRDFALNFIFENASKVLSSYNWNLWIEKNMRLASEILVKLSNHLKREK